MDTSPVPTDVVHAVVSAVLQVFQAVFAHPPDPRTFIVYEESDKVLWLRAHREELASLHANHTWWAVQAEPNVTRLNTERGYRKKRSRGGATERYKARLLACGNEQVLYVKIPFNLFYGV